MAYKLTMLIEVGTNSQNTGAVLHRRAGVTESIYWDGALDQATINSFKLLCAARANLLGSDGVIVGQRYQQVDPVGSAQTSNNLYGSTIDLLTDAPGVSLQLNSRAVGSNNVRRAHIKCIPDTVVVDGEFSPGASGAWFANLVVFTRQLAGWKFRARDLTKPKVNIKSIDANGLVTTTTQLPLAIGNDVTIYSTINSLGKKVNGTFKVSAIPTLLTFQLDLWTGGACEKGKAQQRAIIYPTISFANTAVGKVALLKVGRPFSGFRGRRSKRR